MLAAVNSADEAARILALRATRADDLVEADIIRIELARIWNILVRQRQRSQRGSYAKKQGGGNDAP
jgi:hypothetical protein